ncbi:tail fiber protein [Jatrophihabitans sp.]|uniref:phage tail protein n=1 Tax=Jatrophihabitans sp. TaxID=1932789 RepID=UPI0030C75FA8|nr:phage Tail Collar domain protein [Jatrophihabitans sp.]
MSTPFLAELRIISFNFAPKGWALANGQLLPINQNQALFALLGTTYGGDGIRTFALPDLQGRAAMHVSGTHLLGASGGESTHTLSVAELPAHTHKARGSSAAATKLSPAGAVWAQPTSIDLYAPTANTTLAPAVIGTTGGGQPHENLPPYLVLNVVIALQGIFPSRN